VSRVAPRLHARNAVWPAAGALLTVVVSYLAVSRGATLGLAAGAVLIVFLGSVLAYLSAPHKAIAATIVLFAAIPALKVFISPSIGGIKDVVCIGAIVAGGLLMGFDRRRPDRWIGILVAMFLGLYAVNIGGPHDDAWAQGLRLTGEPTLLLLVGCVLPDPRRNLRWALGAFTATGVVVAFYGLIQQALGVSGLESLGYVYGDQIRQIGPSLRSFGTLDDPFNYAAFLYLAVASAFWLLRRGWLLWVVEGVLLLGLLASFVRTAGLVLLGFLMLAAIHRRLSFPALCLLVAVGVLAGITLSKSSGIQTQAFTVYYTGGGSAVIPRQVDTPSSVLLNGRVSAWTAAVGDRPLDWIFGRGVGAVGTAAQRASVGTFTSGPSSSSSSTSGSQATAVDSGYLATVADVGIVGLLVELALFARVFALGLRHVRRGTVKGWLPVSLLLALMLDAVTRASFTGFPTAFLGVLIIGVALAALDERPAGGRGRGGRPRERQRPAQPPRDMAQVVG
jgi:hypothetical protein